MALQSAETGHSDGEEQEAWICSTAQADPKSNALHVRVLRSCALQARQRWQQAFLKLTSALLRVDLCSRLRLTPRSA